MSTSDNTELFTDGVCFVSVLSVFCDSREKHTRVLAQRLGSLEGLGSLQDVTIETIDDGIGVSNKSSFN